MLPNSWLFLDILKTLTYRYREYGAAYIGIGYICIFLYIILIIIKKNKKYRKVYNITKEFLS